MVAVLLNAIRGFSSWRFRRARREGSECGKLQDKEYKQKERRRGNGGQKGAAYSKGKDDVVAFAGGMVLRLHGQKKGSEAWMG
jgi:hypothetical protein